MLLLRWRIAGRRATSFGLSSSSEQPSKCNTATTQQVGPSTTDSGNARSFTRYRAAHLATVIL
jgi:hypothetical protein